MRCLATWFCLFFCVGATHATPPEVTFPLSAGLPGIQIPYNTLNEVNPFAGDIAVDYGKIHSSFGWLFDTYQATSIETAGSLGRFSPTEMYDSFNPPNPIDVTAMHEDKDWVFHTEFRHQGPYDSGANDFILSAKHAPGDFGLPDGREDRMFAIFRGSDASSYEFRVGNASSGYDTIVSGLQMTNEEYVDIDVHYRQDASTLDLYWEGELVGSSPTGHGRYDLDFIQFEHKADWDGVESWRNFRLGNLGTATIEGDYNGNGIVDAADYTLWADSVSAAGFPGDFPADGDDGTGTGTPDGMVDNDDYNFWNGRFGATTPIGSGSGSTSAIPEPGGLALLFMTMLSLLVTRRFK